MYQKNFDIYKFNKPNNFNPPYFLFAALAAAQAHTAQ